jgi:hypothetical protein
LIVYYYNNIAKTNKKKYNNNRRRKINSDISCNFKQEYDKINQYNIKNCISEEELLSARFFIIKSINEENIHKSIKYGIWSSTYLGNIKMDKVFQESVKLKNAIFLFFSVNSSGRFIGCAKLTSKYNNDSNFVYWTHSDKWKGYFNVTWLIIKDIPNYLLRHLKNEYIDSSNYRFNENKPVTSSRDTQELSNDIGREMISIFKQYKYASSILEEFDQYDAKEYYKSSSLLEKQTQQQAKPTAKVIKTIQVDDLFNTN